VKGASRHRQFQWHERFLKDPTYFVARGAGLRVIYLTQIPRSGFTQLSQDAMDARGVETFYREVAGLSGLGPFRIPIAPPESVGSYDGPESEDPVAQSRSPEPDWIAYVGVADVNRAAETARVLGGNVLLPPTDLPGFGRAAVLRDPLGLAFGVFTPAR